MERRVRGGAVICAVVALVSSGGCGDKRGSSRDGGPSASGTSTAPPFTERASSDRVVASLFDELSSCDVEHRGLLVDLGGDMARGRTMERGEDDAPRKTVEHQGSSWAVMDQRSFELSFTLAERSRLFVGSRLMPVDARSVSFFIDDQSVGAFKLKPGSEAKLLETDPSELPFDAGEHTLVVRFSPARVKEAYAHVDWLRVGFPDDLKATYGAPTLEDLQQTDAALGRVPHRALRMRAPTIIRCPLTVQKGARFRASLGLAGAKEASAEVAVRVDGKPPVKLLTRKLKGGDDATWDDVDADLDPFAGQLVQLELRTAGPPTSGRILFGDPEVVVASAPPEPVQPAQVAVVIVLSGIDRADLPGYGERPASHLERLTKLTERATLFEAHRASTGISAGNMATLLTGLPPEVHTVVDFGSALPEKVPTIAQRARDAAIQTAIFTGVPHSFGPSGLPRGNTKIVEVSPVEGDQRDPLAEAAKWLETTLASSPKGKILLVIHARGGHPPWHVPQKQLDVLPPENYSGEIQPRRAAQQLAMLRKKGSKADLSEQDRARLGALYQLSLMDQDRGIGKVLDALDAANAEDHALVVVTSDQSSGLSTLFADVPSYDERALELPLYVLFPERRLAGVHVATPTGVEDVAATVMGALRLEPPAKKWGRDLAPIAEGVAVADAGPRFALLGDAYSVRSGSLVLREKRKAKATVCDLMFDPTCAFDRRPLVPFATSAMLRALAAYEDRVAQSKLERRAVVLDDGTLAALRVWGSME